MEGVTDYVFRRVQARHFTPADRYYTPFISPTATHKFSNRQLKEVLPENNDGLSLIPQLIGHSAEDFLWASGELKAMGYDEVNFNLGCPSGTVVSKKKGSGLLSERELLTRFFDEVFDKTRVKVSVKTRIGRLETEEFSALLELFSAYPVSELIIHPRLQIQQYKGKPYLPAWETALKEYKGALCYNGDLFTAQAAGSFLNSYPETDNIMLGRGLVANPAIISELKCGTKADASEIKAFHDELYAESDARIGSDKPLIMHMKELWFYLGSSFDGAEKQLKAIRKSQSAADYSTAVSSLFASCRLKEAPGFYPD